MQIKILILNILVVFLATNIFASTTIKLNGIEEYKITENKVVYKIKAQTRNINYEKLKKFRFFNKEKIISNASYYLDGNFSTKDLNIDFKKGYFLEGKFVMLDLNGDFKKSPIKAEKAVFSGSSLFLKKVFITIENRRYRKLKYNLILN